MPGRRARTTRARALVLAAVALLVASTGPAASSDARTAPAEAHVPTVHTVRSVRAVGAVFYPSLLGIGPRVGAPHFCSASALHTRTRDLVVTAAHCVFGTGAGIEFVLQLHDRAIPRGIWQVTAIYVDRRWTESFDPRHDVAVLRVSDVRQRKIEDVVRGRALGTPRPGRTVRVTGYPMGSGGRPVTCTGALRRVHGYSALRCRGFGDGTSGGAWVQRGQVVGVIGGLEQGGCTADVEYSTPFGAAARRLVRRAESGGAGDVVPIGFTANTC